MSHKWGMESGVYALYFGDECLWVGQSKDIHRRVSQHRSKLRRGAHLPSFQSWFDRGRMEGSVIRAEVLELCDDEQRRLKREGHWHHRLRPTCHGTTPQLDGSWAHTLETRAKIEHTLKERAITNGVRESVCCAECGLEFSARTKRKRRFCSNSCSARASRDRDLEARVVSYWRGHQSAYCTEIARSCRTYPALALIILQRNGIEPARKLVRARRTTSAAPLGP